MIILPQKELFTPAEVARHLGISRRTVYIWLEFGKLEGVRVGSRLIKVKRESIMKRLTPLDEQ